MACSPCCGCPLVLPLVMHLPVGVVRAFNVAALAVVVLPVLRPLRALRLLRLLLLTRAGVVLVNALRRVRASSPIVACISS